MEVNIRISRNARNASVIIITVLHYIVKQELNILSAQGKSAREWAAKNKYCLLFPANLFPASRYNTNEGKSVVNKNRPSEQSRIDY